MNDILYAEPDLSKIKVDWICHIIPTFISVRAMKFEKTKKTFLVIWFKWKWLI